MVELLVIFGVSILATFAVCWVFDIGTGREGIGFRDWWRNRPTRADPDKWENFKKNRGLPAAIGMLNGMWGDKLYQGPDTPLTCPYCKSKHLRITTNPAGVDVECSCGKDWHFLYKGESQ